MKKTLVFWLLPFVLLACREKVDAPDVAGVEMEVTVERFDQAFFSMDTNRLSEELVRIRKQEPTFYVDFMQQVLGLPANDSSADVRNNLLFFYEGYRPLYDTLMLAYKPVEDIQQSLRTGLQFVRYYFPSYPSKQKLIFFVGPFDAPGTALTREGMAVGLQQYAGKDFSFYQSPEGPALFPTYISRRFERSYIVVNCMKVLVQELCADPAETGTLIEQMIRRGREAWLLEKFLPHTADSLRMGYTNDQLRWCRANESLIWSYLLNTTDLQTREPEVIQLYLGEAPFTSGLDQDRSPGNLGTWVGRQIVREYVRNHPAISPAELIRVAPEKILEGAAYKPR